ncbi:hypothetical protein GQ42DRAFT_49937 [Ramicandelaber brevisporus]|nr:hypothetical protein GQ42DRAFT_49937 [Ramicandelaber brevisporus]
MQRLSPDVHRRCLHSAAADISCISCISCMFCIFCIFCSAWLQRRERRRNRSESSASGWLCEIRKYKTVSGGVAQMVERSLSMREVQGSIPCSSTLLALLIRLSAGWLACVPSIMYANSAVFVLWCCVVDTATSAAPAIPVTAGMPTVPVPWSHNLLTLSTTSSTSLSTAVSAAVPAAARQQKRVPHAGCAYRGCLCILCRCIYRQASKCAHTGGVSRSGEFVLRGVVCAIAAIQTERLRSSIGGASPFSNAITFLRRRK